MPDDVPRMRGGAVVPPEWTDNEPSVVSDEDLKKSYSDEFRGSLADYLRELETDA